MSYTKTFFSNYIDIYQYSEFELDYSESAYRQMLDAIKVINLAKTGGPLNLNHQVWVDLIYADITKWITFDWDDFDNETFEDIQSTVHRAVSRLWVRLNELKVEG